MLRQRIITALVLAALFLGALFGLNPGLFTLFAALVIGIASWEWAHLASIDRAVGRIAYLLLVAALMIPLYIYGVYDPWGPVPDLVRPVLFIGCLWWALALLWVQGYPSSAVLWGSIVGRLVMGIVILVPAWLALVVLAHLEDGHWLILLVVLVVAGADVGAFFSGRAWGRHKLAPAVSPGKTVEGLAGGLLTVLVVASLFLYASPSHHSHGWQWLVIVAITALASVLGDLVESMVKRHRGVKDSGTILPGHGGLLDRIDSLSAALPVFTLLYLLLIEGGPWLS
ncbi:MAG: phosphatidate cytidylyltransferase [Porticoccaceae bacterium]|nr:phosphatidate cytidylyltransferase [Porticoccaceae bacterium]